MEKQAVRISPEDRGFLFGDGVYEVIKTYSGRLFECDAHLSRLKRSCDAFKLQFNEMNQLQPLFLQLLEKNDMTRLDAAIYLQITRGAADRTHYFPKEGVVPTIFIMVNPCPAKDKAQEKGIKILFKPDIRWARCDIKSVALVPNVLATQDAVEQGASETVFIRDGAVTEGASSNFFAVMDGTVYTHPKSHYILPGITRSVVIELCSKIGLKLVEYPVLESQLETADEMMIVSTTNEVMPVVKYDDKQVGEGIPGPVARKLQKAFKERVAEL
jgi:D-alanine transaminase